MADQTYTPSWKAAGALGESSNSTTVAPAYPTAGNAPVAGDIAIACINKDSNTTISAPDGTWAEIATKEYSTTFRMSLFWKRMAGGESGTVTFTFGAQGGANNNGAGTIHLFSGCVPTGTPYEGVGTSTSGPNGDDQTIPSVTFTAGPRLLVVFDAVGDNHPGSPPGTGGYSEWADIESPAGADSQHHVWGKTLGTSGGTDSPGNCTHTGASGDPWSAIAFALKGYVNVDVTAAAPTLAGKTITFDTYFNSITKAALSPSGAAVSIEKVANPASLSVSGSTITFDLVQGDIDFPVVQAALSTTGQTIVHDLSFNSITAASLSTAGSDILWAYATDVTAGAPSLAGSAITFDYDFAVTNNSLTTQGSELGLEIALNFGVDTAAFEVTGQELTFTQGLNFDVVEADLSTAGSSVTFDEAQGVDNAALSITASSLTTDFSTDVVEATPSLAGSALGLDLAIGVTQSAISITGKDVALEQYWGIEPATVTVQGQVQNFTIGIDFAVTKADLSISGSGIFLDVDFPVGEATLSSTGTSLTLDTTLNFDQASLSTSGSAFTFDSAQDVTSAGLTAQGSTTSLDQYLNATHASITSQGATDISLEWVAGLNFDVVGAALTFSGAAVSIEKVANAAALSIQGQDISLEASRILDVESTALTLSGQAIGLEQYWSIDPAALQTLGGNQTLTKGFVENLTAASLSITGQSILRDLSLGVTPAALSTSGTPVSIEKVASAASLSIAGQAIDLNRDSYINVVPTSLTVSGQDITGVFTQRFVIVDGAAISTQGSWVETIQIKEYDYADLSVTPQTITWGFGIDVTPTAITVGTSNVSLEPNQFIADFGASLTIAGSSDIGYTLVGVQPWPPLDVTPANLSISGGSDVDLQIPPLEVVAAALTAQGGDAYLNAPFGNQFYFDGASLSITGSTVNFEMAGTFSVDVSPASITIQGTPIGQIIGIISDNFGRIDGYVEYVINDRLGGILLYNDNKGGYYVLSDAP